MSFSSLLLVFDPANDLVLVEHQSAVGREAEVRETLGDEGLPYGPRRTADEARGFGDIERDAERRERADFSARRDSERRHNGPWFAQKCPRLGREMGREALPAPKRRKAS